MIPIKIQCECGQRYAFEIEPVGGRMPSTVACPTCGADGTASANAIIAQSVPTQPAVPVAAVAPVRLAVPAQSAQPAAPTPPVRVAAPAQPAQPATTAPALRVAGLSRPAQTEHAAESTTPAVTPVQPSPRRPAPRLPGQVDRTQAEHEARAKILWGDSPKDVTVYLMMQGFNREEATELATELFNERAATLRADGIKKIFKGIGFVCLPIIPLAVFLFTGALFTYLLGACVVGAFWGVYQILKGIFMVVAPKREQGDVASQ